MHTSFSSLVPSLIGFLTVLALAPAAGADTTVPGGSVWGTWDVDGSPYWVTGDITIQEGDTLIVEPGVDVYLQGNEFDAYGYLEAVGTSSDSILFQGGTFFRVGYSDVPSQLAYCSIIDGGQLRVGYTDPEFSNCRLENNVLSLWMMDTQIVLNDCVISGTGQGVEIFRGSEMTAVTMNGCVVENHSTSGIWNSTGDSVIVTDCQFIGNTDEQGGGIRADQGTVSVSGCTFTDNHATAGFGGGIAVDGASLSVSHSTFIDNTCTDPSAYTSGGAIGLSYSTDAEIAYCTFHGNNLNQYPIGGIIGLHYSSATVDHCNFGCVDVLSWAGIFARLSNLSLSNSVFYDLNYEWVIHCEECSYTVELCDYYDAGYTLFGGGSPPDVGELCDVNVNGDSCDVYGNIFLDPMFSDPLNCDYTLQEGSPCIDAGDPSFPYDPDGTITDIGRYYYNQESLFGESAAALPPAGLSVLCRPNPCRGGLLEVSCLQTGAGDSPVTVCLYDVSGRLAAGPSGPLDPIMGRVMLDTSELSPGVYLCRLRAGELSETASVVVMR